MGADDLDYTVAALRRLIGDDVARRREVAEKVEMSEQYLYQLTKEVPLQSGKKRVVGRKLREALDEHFPGWLSPPAAPSAQQGIECPPSLDAALPVVLRAISALSPEQWRMVRVRLDDVPQRADEVPKALADIQWLMQGRPNGDSGKDRKAA